MTEQQVELPLGIHQTGVTPKCLGPWGVFSKSNSEPINDRGQLDKGQKVDVEFVITGTYPPEAFDSQVIGSIEPLGPCCRPSQ